MRLKRRRGQVTPTSFVNVTKWTRTQNSRLLYEAGIGIYDQEYTELYQPGVLSSNSDVFDLNSIGQSNVYTITEQTPARCSMRITRRPITFRCCAPTTAPSHA